MKETVYAPIIIPTLCRFEHLKRCVDSLARCTDADKTELYIGLDYPSKDSHWDGYRKINHYLDAISGFKSVIIIRHEKNLGPSGNLKFLRTMLKEKYDRFIFSEDDNEFSPNFLLYMNQCLTKYKDNPKVFAVCGWSGPMRNATVVAKECSKNAYPMHGFTAFGYGEWFDRIPVKTLLTRDEIVYSFKNVLFAMTHRHSSGIHDMLRVMGSNNSCGDIVYSFHCLKNNLFCIFPKISKVRNWGFDGGGNSCIKWEEATKMDIDINSNFDLDEFEIKDYAIVQKIEGRVYDQSLLFKMYFFVEYIWFRLTGNLLKDSWLFLKIKKIKR